MTEITRNAAHNASCTAQKKAQSAMGAPAAGSGSAEISWLEILSRIVTRPYWHCRYFLTLTNCTGLAQYDPSALCLSALRKLARIDFQPPASFQQSRNQGNAPVDEGD